MSEMLKSAKSHSFISRKYEESAVSLCPILALYSLHFFPLKKKLKSALGSMRDNSNNPSEFLSVCFLTTWLQLCKWNTGWKFLRVRVGDRCLQLTSQWSESLVEKD